MAGTAGPRGCAAGPAARLPVAHQGHDHPVPRLAGGVLRHRAERQRPAVADAPVPPQHRRRKPGVYLVGGRDRPRHRARGLAGRPVRAQADHGGRDRGLRGADLRLRPGPGHRGGRRAAGARRDRDGRGVPAAVRLRCRAVPARDPRPVHRDRGLVPVRRVLPVTAARAGADPVGDQRHRLARDVLPRRPAHHLRLPGLAVRARVTPLVRVQGPLRRGPGGARADRGARRRRHRPPAPAAARHTPGRVPSGVPRGAPAARPGRVGADDRGPWVPPALGGAVDDVRRHLLRLLLDPDVHAHRRRLDGVLADVGVRVHPPSSSGSPSPASCWRPGSSNAGAGAR